MRSPVGHSMPPTSQGCQRITGVADLRHTSLSISQLSSDLRTTLGNSRASARFPPKSLDALPRTQRGDVSSPTPSMVTFSTTARPSTPHRLPCGNTFWLETKPAVFRAARNRQSGPTSTTPRRSVATTKVGRPRRATFIASAEDTIDSRRTISGRSLPNLALDYGGRVHEVGRTKLIRHQLWSRAHH